MYGWPATPPYFMLVAKWAILFFHSLPTVRISTFVAVDSFITYRKGFPVVLLLCDSPSLCEFSQLILNTAYCISVTGRMGNYGCFTSLGFLNSGDFFFFFEWRRSHYVTLAAERATVSCLLLASKIAWEEGGFEKLHRRNIRGIVVWGWRIIGRRRSHSHSESAIKKKKTSSFL